MFRRGKGAEPVVESPEDVDRQATDAAEAETAARVRIAEIDEAFEASVDVNERARLRDERARIAAIRDDARELHSTLIARRERLTQERELAKLDPDRQRLDGIRARTAALRAELAAGETEEAALSAEIADKEETILHPTLSSGEEQLVRWLVQQWRTGSPVGGHLARASRRVQKAAQARMQAVAGSVPDMLADHRKRARRSWEEAGIPQWEPPSPIDVPEVEIAEPTPSNGFPYPRVG